MLRYLVEYGLRVNLNTLDRQGRDMLHYAAMSGNVDKCRYLVERGGMQPLRGDRTLETPFDIAHRLGHRALEDYFVSVVGAPYGQTYHNPIRTGFFPDPSIVRVGEDYYMVNSTFIFFPCIPVSHSRDLVNWRVIGHAIENPAWAHVEGLEGGRGWWAPDISYCNGRFYITATLRMNDVGRVRRRQMVVTATRPEGPYSEPVFFEEDGIDPSIFHDDDGRHYMLLNRGARIFEIDETATRRLSETTLLYYGTNKRAPEGPHLFKKDGWYYLFEAEGGTGVGHRETVSRSRTLHGVYTPSPYNPVIRQWDDRALIQRCGHAKPVSTPDGRWYFVYLCGRSLDGRWTMLGRETALDPFTWTPDGWPLMNGGRGPSEQNILPLPPCPVEDTVDWLTPRPPAPGQIAWQGSAVTLQGSEFAMTDVRCRSILLRRQTSFRFTFAADVTTPAMGEAGLTCYYDENSFLTLHVGKNGAVVTMQAGLECTKTDCASVIAEAGQTVRLLVETDGLRRRFFVNGDLVADLDNVTCLADEGVRMGKRFTGAMVGVYALGCTATFDNQEYHAE
ncbi:MAG: family 43 glycosylhydrolase [Clostridia bacterium]|nr:family 43 glycosylhydrolase [Clostridia bacterium]